MKKLLLIGCLLLTVACQPAESTLAPAPTPISATQTPPATATIPPEPTLTPTPLPPTSLPRFFTEEFDGALPAWAILQSNGGTSPQTRIANGALIFDLTSRYDWVYAILGAQDYTDVRVDALTQVRANTPDAVGLICRYSESNGWYEFNVSGDGIYSVLFGQWLAGGVANYTPIASDASIYIKTDGAQNEIGLSCQADSLSLYINGKLFRKLDVSRFGLTDGKVGLSVASFDNFPVTASFEWVRVGQFGD